MPMNYGQLDPRQRKNIYIFGACFFVIIAIVVLISAVAK